MIRYSSEPSLSPEPLALSILADAPACENREIFKPRISLLRRELVLQGPDDNLKSPKGRRSHSPANEAFICAKTNHFRLMIETACWIGAKPTTCRLIKL